MASRSKKPTLKKETRGSVEMIAQPHGGSLQRGNPDNVGGGTITSKVRKFAARKTMEWAKRVDDLKLLQDLTPAEVVMIYREFRETANLKGEAWVLESPEWLAVMRDIVQAEAPPEIAQRIFDRFRAHLASITSPIDWSDDDRGSEVTDMSAAVDGAPVEVIILPPSDQSDE